MKERLRLLKELYTQKAFGYEFSEPILRQNHQQSSISSTKECQLCQLSKSRKHIVFGDGGINPKVLFIDTMPNIQEDENGKAFQGRTSNMILMMAQNVLQIGRAHV